MRLLSLQVLRAIVAVSAGHIGLRNSDRIGTKGTRVMQLLSLQVLRAVAAISVVVCHAGIQLNYWTKTTIEWHFVTAAGVDLFFVISGFIITLVSWNSFGRIDAVAPFVAR